MLGSLLLCAWSNRDRLPVEVDDWQERVKADVIPKVTDKFIALMARLDKEHEEDRIRRAAGEY